VFLYLIDVIAYVMHKSIHLLFPFLQIHNSIWHHKRMTSAFHRNDAGCSVPISSL
jgi:hypothetical protein